MEWALVAGVFVLYVIFVVVGAMTIAQEIDWKFFGRKIDNSIMALVATAVLGIYFICVVLLSPLLLCMHYILRKTGRNGFYYNGEIKLGFHGFSRRVTVPAPSEEKVIRKRVMLLKRKV